MRRKVFSMVVVMISLLIIYGCLITTQGPATKLKITQDFVPKKTYNLSYDQMWDRVMSVLRSQRIMLSQAGKESGIIQTDYIHGWETDIAAISTTTYRYRYQITFEKINPSQTRVDIICRLEAKEVLRGGSARGAVEKLRPYEDVTHKHQKEAMNLENWLYEQIEKSL